MLDNQTIIGRVINALDTSKPQDINQLLALELELSRLYLDENLDISGDEVLNYINRLRARATGLNLCLY